MKALRTLAAFLVAALALAALGPLAAQKPPPDDLDVAGATRMATDLAAGGGERIRNFASDIAIDGDGTLHVTETLLVRAEGNQIRHGITRDFPTRYERDGRKVRVGFHVESVTRDGESEHWSTERIDNGTRVRIGSADTMLDPGEHSYVIRYTTTRQIGFFPDYDELYWNVTGNGWVFPIDAASVHVRLPRAVPLGGASVYTGGQGSRESNGEIVSQQPGEISFRTTRMLGPYEGMTIAFNWPKGVVTPPPPPSAFSRWLAGNGPIGAAILGLLGIAVFYYQAWRKAGRGPVAGTVVPLFSPPAGMSAAALRYVKDMGYDNRCFAAAIVESGVKGKLRIVETEKEGFFSKAHTTFEKTADGGDLAPPERDMLAGLFSRGDSVEADKAEYKSFQAAQNGLKTGLAAAYKGKLFLSNLGWAFIGLMVLLAAMLLVGAIIVFADPDLTTAARVIAGGGLAIVAGGLALSPRSKLIAKGGSSLLAFLAVVALVIGAVALFVTIGFAGDIGDNVLPIFAPILAMPLVISAFWWMSAPTREGRDIQDKIAGFEQYLSITEEDRLERMHPPEKTPELFERYLPYAIALGVENSWANRFASVLAAASRDPTRQGGSGMAWYVGSQSAWSNPARFVGTVGGALASSVAAASTAPGSSSGSGGGGFSGGGGGGGGGGGW